MILAAYLLESDSAFLALLFCRYCKEIRSIRGLHKPYLAVKFADLCGTISSIFHRQEQFEVLESETYKYSHKPIKLNL